MAGQKGPQVVLVSKFETLTIIPKLYLCCEQTWRPGETGDSMQYHTTVFSVCFTLFQITNTGFYFIGILCN